ncbi:MAG: hypothetical protein AAF390_14695, partial [Pseudomonadota bacterium]
TPSDGPFLDDLNIREPAFLAWRDGVRADPEAVASLCRLNHSRPQGRLLPRICALPLSVPGGEAPLRAVGDWVAEEACRMMSRSSLLAVISHLSGRAMASRVLDIAAVRDTLDVDYLLTGTVRPSGDDLVLDLDLVDAQSGAILWNRHLVCAAARAAGAISDWLVDVVGSVGRSIADSALRLSRTTALSDLPHHGLLIAGAAAMHRRTLRDFVRARQLLDEAVRRSPQDAQTRAWLGKWYVLSIFKGYSADRAEDTRRARDCTARALDIDPDSSFAMTIDGFAHGNILGDFGTAERRYAAALEISPNESLAWLLRGSLMAFRDEGAAAIRATETARSLSPIDPFGYYFDSLASSAHLVAGDYQRALTLAERSMVNNDGHISTLRTRIAALHLLDRPEDAKVAAQDLQRRFPDFSLSEYRRTHPSMGHRIGRTMVDALAASGLS